MLTTSTARTAAARQSIRAWSAAVMVKPSRKQHPRATLDGLQVQEADFSAWLSAGGDRRVRARVSN